MPYLHPTTYIKHKYIHILLTYINYLYNFMCAILENWHFQMTLKWILGQKRLNCYFFYWCKLKEMMEILPTKCTNRIDCWNFPHFPQQWFDIHTQIHSHSEHIYNANDKFNYPVNISNYSPFKQLNSNVQVGCKIVHKCWQLWTLT